MSTTPLSDIQEVLERTIFHAIRKECVDKLYLPDITTYAKTTAGQTLWNTALAAIATGAQGFAIEVFNNSNPDSKGVKTLPRIVVVSQDFLPGSLGGGNTRYYKPNVDGRLDKMKRPPQTSDYFFNVHLIARNVKQSRIINAITAIAVPRRGYIPLYNDPEEHIFVEVISSFNTTDNANGIIEYVYRYAVRDVFEIEDTFEEEITPIEEITVTPQIGGIDGDDIVIT